MKLSYAAVGLAGLLMAGSAHAGLLPGNPIYSSFTTGIPDTNGGTNDNYALQTGAVGTIGSPLAQEFAVPAGLNHLSSLWLRLSDATPADGGSVLVYLVPDNGSHLPSSTGTGNRQLTNTTLLGTILDASLPAPTREGCAFGAGANINACNTQLLVNDTPAPGNYWIALVNGSDTNNGGTNGNSSGAVWWRAGDNLGLNAAGMDNAHVNGSGVLTAQNPTNITQSFELQVNVPEPASMALLGAGLIGLGFVRRRASKAAAE